MKSATEFLPRLRQELEVRGLLGVASAREACAARARELGGLALAEIESLVGTVTFHRALAVRRGHRYAESYRYVTGYGELMTQFLTAPIALDPVVRARVVRLGALANLIVSYFDEMVDGGWPRSLLLPHWALRSAATRPGRLMLDVAAYLAPPPSRLTTRLVSDYFCRLASLPYAAHRPRVFADVRGTITEMYLEEGRTPREWRRLRGDAARQKKTALPFVVLGLPAWLGCRNCRRAHYDRHRRWLVRLGKFIRWIDDAADMTSDETAGSANLVLHALMRRDARADAGTSLAVMIGQRGSWLREEWRAQMEAAGHPASSDADVLATVLVAWLGVPQSDGAS